MERNRISRKKESPEATAANVAVILVFLAMGVFLFLPLFPPFGILWCAVLGMSLYRTLKKEKETKSGSAAERVGRDWKQLQDDSRQAGRKYLSRIREEEVMEERQHHSHTPMAYSYDACAVERRLEQIKTLKEAGLLTEEEYKQRRQKILAGK